MIQKHMQAPETDGTITDHLLIAACQTSAEMLMKAGTNKILLAKQQFNSYLCLLIMSSPAISPEFKFSSRGYEGFVTVLHSLSVLTSFS